MRFSTVLCSAAAVSLCAVTFASAQTAKAPAKNGNTSDVENRYFTGLGDILGDLPVDAFIKETRDGGKITSTLLDVCYSVSVTSDRKDRFVVELKPDGPKLTGAGQTTEGKLPVVVNLTRKPASKTITFEGKITIGDKPSLVSSTDNTDSDQREFEASQTIDDSVTENPQSFTELSPQSLAAKVKRENFADLLASLRNENVEVSLDSLATDCAALRTGAQLVRLNVDPARAAALVTKLKSSPGVLSAGWTTGDEDIERAIRLDAANWRNGDKLDRDRLTTAISASAAKVLGAQPAGTKWNETTGDLTVSLKRPNLSVPSLHLTDTIDVSVLIGPEKPAGATHFIVWIGVPSTTTRDETAGPHLSFSEAAANDEGESSFSDDDGLVRGIAADLKAQRWDAEQAAWK